MLQSHWPELPPAVILLCFCWFQDWRSWPEFSATVVVVVWGNEVAPIRADDWPLGFLCHFWEVTANLLSIIRFPVKRGRRGCFRKARGSLGRHTFFNWGVPLARIIHSCLMLHLASNYWQTQHFDLKSKRGWTRSVANGLHRQFSHHTDIAFMEYLWITPLRLAQDLVEN